MTDPKKPAPVGLTNQLALVITVGIIGVAGLVLGLAVWADWSDGAIVGMVVAFGSVFTTAAITVRGQQRNAEQLTTIQEQTNGKSRAELDQTAFSAASKAVSLYTGAREPLPLRMPGVDPDDVIRKGWGDPDA
jgi:hypothetical protein